MVVDADTDEGVRWCEDNLSIGIYSVTAKGAHFYFKQSKNLSVTMRSRTLNVGST